MSCTISFIVTKYTKDQLHINFDFCFFKAKFLFFKYNEAEIRGETQYLQLYTRDVLSVKKQYGRIVNMVHSLFSWPSFHH